MKDVKREYYLPIYVDRTSTNQRNRLQPLAPAYVAIPSVKIKVAVQQPWRRRRNWVEKNVLLEI